MIMRECHEYPNMSSSDFQAVYNPRNCNAKSTSERISKSLSEQARKAFGNTKSQNRPVLKHSASTFESDYDKFAEEFSKTRSAPWKEVTDFLEELPKGARILDIGCGNGRHIIEAEKRGLSAVGIDISRNLLKIAKKKTGAPLILGNALALPFKENAFDNSICIAVVHHFKTEVERKKCLKEIARVTQNSSLVSVWAFEQEKFKARKSQDIQLGWTKESSRSASASLEAFEGYKPSKHPRFYHLFKEGELDKIAEAAGLKAKKSWRAGNNYWSIVEILGDETINK